MNDDRFLHDALQNATDTRQIIMGAGVLPSAVEVFKQTFSDRPAIVIADDNTFDVAGREVQRQLAAAHHPSIEPFIFPGKPQLHANYEHVVKLESALRQCWPKLRERLVGQLLPAVELRDLLRVAGCPTSPEEIGLDCARLKASYAQARQVRSRYTIFDLAAEAGCLTECVENLFAPGGFRFAA